MAKLAKPVDDRHVTVEVWLDETSQPIILAALNTYTKGPMYCVYRGNQKGKGGTRQ